MKIHPLGHTDALSYAIKHLKDLGISFVNTPEDASHILLPVPSFEPNGSIKGGGPLPRLQPDTMIIGGGLDRPELEEYRCIDLLDDETYTAKNAMITAQCALKYAMERMPVTFTDCPVLIIGFGRIGKCLAKLLSGLDAKVSIAARKAQDRAIAQALGYGAVPTDRITPRAFRVIYNTVPVMVLPDGGSAIKIDLASQPGIGGQNVFLARGLPNKDAPESSGKLIAETVLRLIDK